MSDGGKIPFRIRYYSLLVLLIICFLFLLARMIQLTLYERPFLEKQGNARSMRTLELSAFRGTIRDRFGEPLAMSVPVKSIWIDPHQFSLTSPEVPRLLALLGEKKSTLVHLVSHHDTKAFIYLNRQVSLPIAEKIIALNIPGVYAADSYERYYPEGASMAPVIGFTDIDNKGQEGVELAYDDWLQGTPGREVVEKDLYGHVIAIKALMREAKPGKDLTLSLDTHVQYQAYHALQNAVTKHKAASASMVILDVKTGEILAMANYPAYDPNAHHKIRNDNYKNRAVTDLFEPGSTIKTFAVANALQSGHYQLKSVIDTTPGWLYLNSYRVDDDGRQLGIITIADILAHSSNVGITKLTLSLPRDSLWRLLDKVGFGKKTSLNFPGESAGELPHRQRWSDISLANLSFGYGLSVNALQLVAAYGMLANHGHAVSLSLIKDVNPSVYTSIIKADVADNLLQVLQNVVSEHGTANLAKIPGYAVSGKTGTVRMLGPHGYDPNHHIAIFVGVVPVANPKFVAAVIVRDPGDGDYYGGKVAAPIFAEVMEKVLHEYSYEIKNII